jgi:hypothetical protein
MFNRNLKLQGLESESVGIDIVRVLLTFMLYVMPFEPGQAFNITIVFVDDGISWGFYAIGLRKVVYCHFYCKINFRIIIITI